MRATWELEVLSKTPALPNPAIEELKLKIAQLGESGVPPEKLQQAEEEIEQKVPPLVSSLQIERADDNATEAFTCWQFMMSPEGRKLRKNHPDWYENVELHWMDHQKAAEAKAAAAAQGKPPSMSIGWKDVAAVDMGAAGQMLAKDGIIFSPGCHRTCARPKCRQ